MKFFAPLRISENISKTPEGYLLCRNVSIGRTGEMVYGVGETPLAPGPDGKVYVTRAAEELFRPETIASFEGKAVTILHPEDFVNPGNWAQLTKGVVQNVRRGTGEQENDLVADFLITVQDAITLVEEGLREVSCGYEAEYTQTGVGRGFQSAIVGNHVALVEEGRAGAAYAINDHKGEGSRMKLSDKIKAIFAKAQDEALKVAGGEDTNTETPETKEGFVTIKDMQSYMDASFKKMTDSFAEMMGKKKEGGDAGEKQDPQTGKPAEPVAKDAEPDGMAAVLAKIEERLAKLEARENAEEEVQVGDEDEDGEESEDEDLVEAEPTGDSAGGDEDEDDEMDVAARVEILAPGMDAKGKNVKAKALLAAYGTKDGKAAIDTFTGGKSPNTKDAKLTDALFVGVSEILKTKRSEQIDSVRQKIRDRALSSLKGPKGAKTAEDINEINTKYYGGGKS